MPELKARLHADLNVAMKARDELTTATLRMALTAVTTEEVAGKQARELSDDEVQKVLAREGKKRREAAEAYDAANRPELAARERAEGGVLDRYLPAQLDDAELADRIGIISGGKLHAEGTLDDLRALAGEGEATLEDTFIRLTQPAAVAA